MEITGDYPHPITVNGYSCRNCADVEKAKHNVDPTQSENATQNSRTEAAKPEGQGLIVDIKA